MAIIASLGALSYPRSNGDTSNYQYWYLQSLDNTTYAGGTFDSSTTNFFISGQNITTNRASLIRINELNIYPQLVYDFDLNFFNSTNNISTCTGISSSSVANTVILYGSTANNTTSLYYSFRYKYNTASTSENIYPFGTPGNASAFFSVLTPPSLDQSTMLDATDTWVLYKDQNRLFYRIPRTSIGANNPKTYVIIPTTVGLPQSISTDSTGNGIATLNIVGGTLIRSINKTFVNATYDYYPTIWQRRYSFGTIYDNVLDASNNIYFISTNSANSTTVKYDINGNLLWQRQINGVKLTAMTYDASYIYVVGNIVSNNNLFMAKYDLSGNIQWQTNVNGATFIAKSVIIKNNSLYVVGQSNARGFSIKVPSDGSIPGTGSFNIAGINFTYSISSQTETSASNTSTTPVLSDTSLGSYEGAYANVWNNNNGQVFVSTSIA